MRNHTIWLLNISAVLALMMLMFLTYLCLDQIRSTVWFNERVDNAHKTILESDRLLAHMKNAESSILGYAVTRNNAFLKTYRLEKAAYGISEHIMDSLMHEDVRQIKRLGILRNLARDKWQFLERSITLSTQTTTKASELESNILKSKAIMDAIQETVLEIQTDENQILVGRTTARQRQFNLTPAYLIAMAALAGMLLVSSAVLLNREFQQRLLSQKDLERKVDALNRSNSELEQFAYVASHDLQEPLRKIRAFADRLVMRQREQLSEDGQLMLDKISKAAERMQGLINDLLTFSRMVSKPDEKKPIDLNQIIDDVKSDLSESVSMHQASIISDPLPIIQAYPTQIAQLFLNLLTNALKFKKTGVNPKIAILYQEVSGEALPHLTSELKQQQNYHQIVIRDNGIGFSPEYAEKIFIIFQRLHAKSEYEGTGIGLAICRRVVANHEGYIFAEGKPGEGAIFTIYLPVDTV